MVVSSYGNRNKCFHFQLNLIIEFPLGLVKHSEVLLEKVGCDCFVLRFIRVFGFHIITSSSYTLEDVVADAGMLMSRFVSIGYRKPFAYLAASGGQSG